MTGEERHGERDGSEKWEKRGEEEGKVREGEGERKGGKKRAERSRVQTSLIPGLD